MAYKRRFYAKPKRYYYKRAKTSRSVKAITTSRAFKASSQNMTQNAKFNVNKKFTKDIQVAQLSNNGAVKLDLANELAGSDMHRYLSNVFDQYKVEKATLKCQLLIGPNLNNAANDGKTQYLNFFSCVDRSGFATGVTLTSLRTYGSFKETTWSMDGSSNVPHFVNIGQTDLVSRSEYYDTKNRASFPEIYIGVDLGQPQNTGVAINYTITFELDCQVRYRGVRLDTSGVLVRI